MTYRLPLLIEFNCFTKSCLKMRWILSILLVTDFAYCSWSILQGISPLLCESPFSVFCFLQFLPELHLCKGLSVTLLTSHPVFCLLISLLCPGNFLDSIFHFINSLFLKQNMFLTHLLEYTFCLLYFYFLMLHYLLFQCTFYFHGIFLFFYLIS